MKTMRSRLLAVLAALALGSCQMVFTTSQVAFLARDQYSLPSTLTVAQATTLLQQAQEQGDVAMASALVAVLYEAAAGATPGSAEYEAAAAQLVSAVVLASGAESAMSQALSLFAADAGEEAAFSDTVRSILAAVTLTDDQVAAMALVAASPPDSLEAEPALMAAVALAAAAANQVPDLDVTDPATLTPEVQAQLDAIPAYATALDMLDVAAAIVTASGEESLLGDLIGQILGGLPQS